MASALNKRARIRDAKLKRAKDNEPPPLNPPFPYVAIPLDPRFLGVGYVAQVPKNGAQITTV